jgi:hypothetical protein
MTMASRREQVLLAASAMLEAAAPGAEFSRNKDKASKMPAGGQIILRDGDPGAPEVTLCPVSYTYSHRIALEIGAPKGTTTTREENLDALLVLIGQAVAADRTLGGLCEYLDLEAPITDDISAIGAVSERWADVGLIAIYTTTNPLT